MKKFILITVIIILLLLTAWVTPLLLRNPGLLQLEVLGYQVQMTAITAALLVITLLFILWLVWSLLKTPKKVANKLTTYQQSKKFDQGLLAFSEGHWSKAEKLLLQSAKRSSTPQLSYMAAARAALAQNQLDTALSYLDAAEKTVNNPLTVDLTRCEIWMKAGHLQQARGLLTTILKSYPNNPRAVYMMMQISQRQNDHQSLKNILPKAQKLAIVDKLQSQHLRQQATHEGLQQAQDETELTVLWSELSRKQQKYYLNDFCESGLRLGAHQVVTDEIEGAQKYHFDDQLVNYWSQLPFNFNHRLKVAQKWNIQHPKNRTVLICLGQLQMAKEQWNDARQTLHKALTLQTDPQVHLLLAETYRQLQETEQAMSHYAKAHETKNALTLKGSSLLT